MAVTLSPAAERDIEEIGDYIHADNPSAALHFVGKLRDRCQRLAHAPRGGRLRPELGDGLRSVPFGHYVIFYTLAGDEVRIERILHGARDIETLRDEEL